MGCDIHAYSESFIDGFWVADAADTYKVENEECPEEDPYYDMDSCYSGRNYFLFGILAGVRWDLGELEFPEKGFPEDASTEVEKLFIQWDGASHTPSYLTLEEIKAKATECLVSPLEYARDANTVLIDLISELPASNLPDDQRRIVFWFDN